ncbi:glycosyltransferase [Brytella acorum]|uniref:Glycosyltransferase n=1 Tax=Brytella acorum TaxID=2959299 RepID=A0AA35UIU0_9PROT|nr:glycosyltransferase [Brytella acorum]CAI9122312.1 glycosyltransferase [Brytella acorum]
MRKFLWDESVTGRQSAWDHFDLAWMKDTYPEICELFGPDASLSFDEILLLAGTCGYQPNPYFDEAYYVRRYADVRHAINQGQFVSGFDHYRRSGCRDRNPHWLFCEEYYLRENGDVARSLANETEFRNGYDHYIQCGDEEFRSGSWFFDPLKYIKSATETGIKSPFRHYLFHPKNVFDNLYFDRVWYAETYPEICLEVKKGSWHSLLHQYLSNINNNTYDPSRYFSERFYIESNPDLVPPVASGQFISGYEHFLLYGIRERRRPRADIDLERFYHHPYVQKLFLNGRVPDVFIAWCRFDGIVPNVQDLLEQEEAATKFSFEKKSAALAINAARSRLDFSCTQPDISIIVVLHNNFDMTLNALTALRSSHRRDIQLIIVDSGSYDETCHIEHYVKGATLLRFGGNVAFIRACNEAVRHAQTPFLLFLNNDTEIQLGSIQVAIERLRRDPKVGAIGGKMVRSNGLLQEAGAVIYRDGSVAGYMRGASPDVPEANFVRRVDFCSGAALFTRTELFKNLGGFDEEYIPAYYEETDYCVKIWKSGHEVIYDPSIMTIHYEYGSSNIKDGTGYINRNRKIFNSKHADFLSKKFVKSKLNTGTARSVKNLVSKRILFIEDRVPLKCYGSGFSRSHDIVTTMSEMGHEVTVFPIFKPVVSSTRLYNAFPDSVEIIWDRDINDLEKFFSERSGFYDILWICRTQNVRRLVPIIEKISHLMPSVRIVADTEAVSAVREEQYDQLVGTPEDKRPTLSERVCAEVECLLIATKIVAVSRHDADFLTDYGFTDVSVLGHVQTPKRTAKRWTERTDILFVGAIHDENSPNYDSLIWLVKVLWPALEGVLPDNARLLIAGHLGPRVTIAAFPQSPKVIYIGELDDLTSLYDSARFFIAPTRYAAGIPYKLYEAAAYGLPIIASDILCQSMDWEIGEEILQAKTGNLKNFYDVIIAAYHDHALWTKLRRNGLNRIMRDNTEYKYKKYIGEILG